MHITPFHKNHFDAVAAIYKEGLQTGVASFETSIPTWGQWDVKFLKSCRFVAIIDNQVAGWCALSSVSKRGVYKGVAEDTIYVASKFRDQGVGRKLLQHLLLESEQAGFWSLQASIFPQNKSSIRLHATCGFRKIGMREKIAQRDGVWHDNILMERRKIMKNILVLCTGNSCRSQMAHGYLEHFANQKATIYSAGIETHGLNPRAVDTMKADGIDISKNTSNHVDEYKEVDFDFIITVCDHANENCPFIPSKNAVRIHHNFSDPSKLEGTELETITAFAATREEIKDYCRNFIETNL